MAIEKKKPTQKSGGRPSKLSLQQAQKDLDERQLMYASWLATPDSYRMPRTRTEIAAEIGVKEVTLWRWSKEPRFQAAVRWLTLHHAGDPARISNVIDFIYQTVLDESGSTRQRLEAAREYLKAVGVYQTWNTTPELLEVKDVSEIQLDNLSDEEVWALYNERAGAHGDLPVDLQYDIRAISVGEVVENGLDGKIEGFEDE